jgi:2-dehydro-3-deoxyphosphogluconate aldolase/(4S)-4-hydroxy-2-oxoglutarate aldolase
MPTGGINPKNVNSYLSIPRVVACGGTWMVDKTMINQGQWDEIGRLAKEAAELVK